MPARILRRDRFFMESPLFSSIVSGLVDGMGEQGAALRISVVQSHMADSHIIIGVVVVYQCVGIAAGRIPGVLVFAVFCHNAALGHGHGPKNVEKLNHCLPVTAAAPGFLFDKNGLDEPGTAGKISGQPKCAQTERIVFQGKPGTEIVHGETLLSPIKLQIFAR
jgi:hypothetical protein